MKVVICIDYDNLSSLQKSAGILGVVQKTLIQASEMFSRSLGTCEIRLYGGWYEGDNFSVLSQQLSVSIQAEFPAVLRVPNDGGGITVLRATAELAVSLLEEPSHQLFNTYRRKGRPSNIRVETPASVGCSTLTCPLPLAKKLLQKGRCPTQGCITGGASLVYRHEQKLVDTMLTCDLMYLSSQAYDFIFILSADDDFLPPIRTLLLRGAKIIRVHPQMSSALVPIKVGAATLIELGIQ
ncbi:NYN domain-containing protein [Pseudomonas sp. ARP3]|uniref:NYN domain-containing protein n=1 Tax=Pseudomonas sp. ARP3 TaxID=1661386 RepID=UPI00064B919D|nr:NYN domain-containing protein [Pseudomonas sp. ARP3]